MGGLFNESFDECIARMQNQIKENENKRINEEKKFKTDMQCLASELDSDPRMKELLKEIDTDNGLLNIIQDRTGVSLY